MDIKNDYDNHLTIRKAFPNDPKFEGFGKFLKEKRGIDIKKDFDEYIKKLKGVSDYSEFRDVVWNNKSDSAEDKLIMQAFLERNFPELQREATPLMHEIIDHQFQA